MYAMGQRQHSFSTLTIPNSDPKKIRLLSVHVMAGYLCGIKTLVKLNTDLNCEPHPNLHAQYPHQVFPFPFTI
jgi:hypothetical protein